MIAHTCSFPLNDIYYRFNCWPHIHLGSLVQRRNGANTRWSTGYVAWVKNHLLMFFFSFWLCHGACKMLFPRPGISPASVEAWRPNHWTAKEVSNISSLCNHGVVYYCSITWPILPPSKNGHKKKAWLGHVWEDLGWKGQLSWGLSGLIFSQFSSTVLHFKAVPRSLSFLNSIWDDSVWHKRKGVCLQQMWPLMVAECFEDEMFPCECEALLFFIRCEDALFK